MWASVDVVGCATRVLIGALFSFCRCVTFVYAVHPGLFVGFFSAVVSFFFFFFQAEDGIRDTSVTGVQTCAFPIFRDGTGDIQVMLALDAAGEEQLRRWKDYVDLGDHVGVEGEVITSRRGELSVLADRFELTRSEERRVGKEWRCGWWPERKNEKVM